MKKQSSGKAVRLAMPVQVGILFSAKEERRFMEGVYFCGTRPE